MFRQTLQRLKAPPQSPMFPASKTGLAPGPPRGATRPVLDDFYPSPKVLKFAAQFNITFPDALRLVPGQKLDDFPIRLSICSRHVFSYYHLGFLNALEHPLTDKTLYFYAEEQQSKPLWCYVQASMADGSKAVVRHTSERFVRAALFRALNAAGYDSCGRRLDGTAGQIRGTIRIGVTQPKAILKVKFDRLIEYLSKLVAGAVPRLAGARKPVP